MKNKALIILLFMASQSAAISIRFTLNNNSGVQLRVTAQCIKPGQKAGNINTDFDPIDAQRIVDDRTSGFLIFNSYGVCNIEATQSNAAGNVRYFGQLGLDIKNEMQVPTPGFSVPKWKRNLTWWLVGNGLVDDGVNPPYWDVTYTLQNPESFIY
jgi:hypothetical protein